MESSEDDTSKMNDNLKGGFVHSFSDRDPSSFSRSDFSSMKDSFRQIADLLLPYRSSCDGVPAIGTLEFPMPTDEVPKILFSVLQDFEKLRSEHSRQSFVLSQYEKSVTRYFNTLGELRPPTLQAEQDRVLELYSQTDFKSGESGIGRSPHTFSHEQSSDGSMEPSIWFWKDLQKLRVIIPESEDYLFSHLLDIDSSVLAVSEIEKKGQFSLTSPCSFPEDIRSEMCNSIRAISSLPEDKSCSADDPMVSHRYISTVLNGATASIQGWKHVAQGMRRRRNWFLANRIQELEKEIGDTIVLLKYKGEETREIDHCPLKGEGIDGATEKDPVEDNGLMEEEELQRLCGFWKKLKMLISERYSEECSDEPLKEELIRQRRWLEEERSKCRGLERDREGAIELLSMMVDSPIPKATVGTDTRNSKIGFGPLGSTSPLTNPVASLSMTVPNDNGFSSLMNCLDTSKSELVVEQSEKNEKKISCRDLRSFVSDFQKRLECTLQGHERKEQGLRKKCSELSALKDVVRVHASALKAELLPKTSGGEEENVLAKEEGTEVSKEELSAFSLSEEFTPGELKDHLSVLRKKYIGLQKLQRRSQYDCRERNVQLQRLNHQVSVVKKWQTQCSSILLEDLVPLLGLEDAVGILLLEEESTGGKKTDLIQNQPPYSCSAKKSEMNGCSPPMLAGFTIVYILELFKKEIAKIQRTSLSGGSSFPADETSPKVSLISSLIPGKETGPTHVKNGVEKEKVEEKSVPDSFEQEASFREAMKVVLQRLAESGIRIKETLFVLGTDETPQDDLLEDLTRMFLRGAKKTDSNAPAIIDGDGRPPLGSSREEWNVCGKKKDDTTSDDVDRKVPGESSVVTEQQLAALLQKYSRWTTRLSETVRDHHCAQRKFSKYFAKILLYFSKRIPSSSLPTTLSSTENTDESPKFSLFLNSGGAGGALREMAEGFTMNSEPLNNLIDLDCALLDSVEMVLGLLVEEKTSREKEIGFFQKEVDACQLSERRKDGEEKEGIVGVAVKERDVIHREEESRGEKGEGKQDDALDTLCDPKLVDLYNAVREMYTVVFALSRVQYLIAPPPEKDALGALTDLEPSGERKKANSCRRNGGEENATEEGDASQFIDVALVNILRSDHYGFSSPAARKEHNNRVVWEILIKNFQYLNRELFSLGTALKDVAIVLQQDIEGVRQQVSKMLREWSTVDVEESWIGQKRSLLGELYEELSNNTFQAQNGPHTRTREKGRNMALLDRSQSYWLARHTNHKKMSSTSPSNGASFIPNVEPYSSPVWQVALQFIGDGFEKLIFYLSQRTSCPPPSSSSSVESQGAFLPPQGGGEKRERNTQHQEMDSSLSERKEEEENGVVIDVLAAELNDIGAMYINWLENEEWSIESEKRSNQGRGWRERQTTVSQDVPTIPPLPSLVRRYCVREQPLNGKIETSNERRNGENEGLPGDSATPSVPHGVNGLSGGKDGSHRPLKASHFSSAEALPELFMHMFALTQKGWSAMTREYKRSEASALHQTITEESEKKTRSFPASPPPSTKPGTGGGAARSERTTIEEEGEGNVRMMPIGPVCVPVPPSSSLNSSAALPQSFPSSLAKKGTKGEMQAPPLGHRLEGPSSQVPGSSFSSPFTATSSSSRGSNAGTPLDMNAEMEWWWRQINEPHLFTSLPPRPSVSPTSAATLRSGVSETTNEAFSSSSAPSGSTCTLPPTTSSNVPSREKVLGKKEDHLKHHRIFKQGEEPRDAPGSFSSPAKAEDLSHSYSSASSSSSPFSSSFPMGSTSVPSREDMLNDVLSYLQMTLNPSSWSFLREKKRAEEEMNNETNLVHSKSKSTVPSLSSPSRSTNPPTIAPPKTFRPPVRESSDRLTREHSGRKEEKESGRRGNPHGMNDTETPPPFLSFSNQKAVNAERREGHRDPYFQSDAMPSPWPHSVFENKRLIQRKEGEERGTKRNRDKQDRARRLRRDFGLSLLSDEERTILQDLLKSEAPPPPLRASLVNSHAPPIHFPSNKVEEHVYGRSSDVDTLPSTSNSRNDVNGITTKTKNSGIDERGSSFASRRGRGGGALESANDPVLYGTRSARLRCNRLQKSASTSLTRERTSPDPLHPSSLQPSSSLWSPSLSSGMATNANGPGRYTEEARERGQRERESNSITRYHEGKERRMLRGTDFKRGTSASFSPKEMPEYRKGTIREQTSSYLGRTLRSHHGGQPEMDENEEEEELSHYQRRWPGVSPQTDLGLKNELPHVLKYGSSRPFRDTSVTSSESSYSSYSSTITTPYPETVNSKIAFVRRRSPRAEGGVEGARGDPQEKKSPKGSPSNMYLSSSSSSSRPYSAGPVFAVRSMYPDSASRYVSPPRGPLRKTRGAEKKGIFRK